MLKKNQITQRLNLNLQEVPIDKSGLIDVRVLRWAMEIYKNCIQYDKDGDGEMYTFWYGNWAVRTVKFSPKSSVYQYYKFSSGYKKTGAENFVLEDMQCTNGENLFACMGLLYTKVHR